MNLIIPMAGIGKRLRPHTLTTPKPLIPIAGKPIVQRLVEDIVAVTPEAITTIGFIIGKFGKETEEKLLNIASEVGAQGKIFYQEEALGTAHAIHCASDLLEGKVTIAFADTLFKASFTLDTANDGIIWVKKIDDPSAFGVVLVNESGIITEFVEKPKVPVSDLAIIGIYYFKDGGLLKREIDEIIGKEITVGGEYQLTTALESLKAKGVNFVPETVSEWLDCGNKKITVQSNSTYLSFSGENEIADTAKTENSVLIPPVFIGDNAEIRNSVIGPFVSIGERTRISNSRIQESLVQADSQLENVNLTKSMIGNHVVMEAIPQDVSLGDYSELKI